MTTSEQCKVIKRALSAVYGSKNVSVTKGTGTAFMWIHAYVTNDSPDRRSIAQHVRTIAKEALAEVGEEFSTYLSDDGYDTESDCFLVQIR